MKMCPRWEMGDAVCVLHLPQHQEGLPVLARGPPREGSPGTRPLQRRRPLAVECGLPLLVSARKGPVEPGDARWARPLALCRRSLRPALGCADAVEAAKALQ